MSCTPLSKYEKVAKIISDLTHSTSDTRIPGILAEHFPQKPKTVKKKK